jgi:putative membrane protein
MGQWMGWWMPFHGLFPLLFLVLFIASTVALFRSLFGRGAHPHDRERLQGLEVLGERYAKGEIQRDEYLQKKRDLGG